MDNTNYIQSSAEGNGRYKNLFTSTVKQVDNQLFNDEYNKASFYNERSSRLWNHVPSKQFVDTSSVSGVNSYMYSSNDVTNNMSRSYESNDPGATLPEHLSHSFSFVDDKIESCSEVSQGDEGVVVINKVDDKSVPLTKRSGSVSDYIDHLDLYDKRITSKSKDDFNPIEKFDRSTSINFDGLTNFIDGININNPFKPSDDLTSSSYRDIEGYSSQRKDEGSLYKDGGSLYKKDEDVSSYRNDDFTSVNFNSSFNRNDLNTSSINKDVNTSADFNSSFNRNDLNTSSINRNDDFTSSINFTSTSYMDDEAAYLRVMRGMNVKYDEGNSKADVNPFTPLVCNLNSEYDLTELDIDRMKTLVLSGKYSDDLLVKYFKESTTITNVSMMNQIVSFLVLLMKETYKIIPTCIRLMSTALGYHPEEFIESFRCEYLSSLFNPMVDDDVGGGFIRLLLSYKSTFGTPGVLEDNMPLSLDDDGQLVYTTDGICDYDCGKLESLELLRICMNRCKVKSAFDLPSSKLRNLLCNIWYEMPMTCPKLPLAQLCYNWINFKDESINKDLAFALLQRLKESLGLLKGGTWLLSELIIFILDKDCRVNYELESIIELIDIDDNLYYSLDIIINKFNEKDMLDLWCCLCVLSWPTLSPDRPYCRLLSTTLRVFYNISLERSRNNNLLTDDIISPLSLLENCLRICICRCLSRLNALDSILQSLLLIDIDPYTVITDKVSPLVLRSISPFLWKCHFLWTRIKDGINYETLTALIELYNKIQKSVQSPPLSLPPNNNNDKSYSKSFTKSRSKFKSISYHNIISSFINKNNNGEDVGDIGNMGRNGVDYEENNLIQDRLYKCGLKNLGNTCYYNSLLQALYHTRYFVYNIYKWNMDTKKCTPYLTSLYILFKKMISGKKK